MARLVGKTLRNAYRVGIAIKGFDGIVELLAGLALWIFPLALERALAPLLPTVAGDHPIRNFVGYWAGRMDHELSSGSHTFVVLFLLAHGVVKVALVYCLLKEYHWVYPYGIGVLALFTIYQAYVLVTKPSWGVAAFTVLDVVIIYLVWREWQELKAKAASTESVSTE